MASGMSSTSPPSGLLSLVSESPTTYGSTQSQNETSLIGLSGLRKLCTLLRNEGDKVLNGHSLFTLTSDVLSHLLVSCRRHSILNDQAQAVPNQPIQTSSFVIKRAGSQHLEGGQQEEWSRHVQFIKDFMLSTPNLKLVHNQGTLSFPISLHRFGNISKLQLRRIPIHMVEGLHMHRQSLESLTVYRGVSSLKDLLESCGGDRSAPHSWPRLRALSLMFNTIPDLDDSLRFLPHVETLDLSHNCLEKCDVYLEYLGDLVFISLAYNLLTTVPSFSLSSRASLVSLVLRGNNLDQIKGIENLIVLEELDLGENCISDHSFLEPLYHLTRLGQLQLDANPLFYHRRHRQLTASCLSRQALRFEFELDKKRLTLSEISYYAPRSGRKSYQKVQVPPVTKRSPQRSSTPERRLSLSSGIGTEPESSDIVVRSPRKSKRKRLKPRETEIMESSGDFTSSRDASPGTTPGHSAVMRMRTQEALRTKEQVEELRRNYGPNWLQAIEDRNIFNIDKSGESPRSLPNETAKADTGSISTAENIKASKSKKREKNTQRSRASPSDGDLTLKSDTGNEGDVKTEDEGGIKKEDEGGVKTEDERVRVNHSVESDIPDSTTQCSTTCPSDSDVFTSSERVEAVNPIMAALARLAAQQAEGEINVVHGVEGDKRNSFSERTDPLPSTDLTSATSGSTAATSEQTTSPSSAAASTLSKQVEALSPIKSTLEDEASSNKSVNDESSSFDVDRSTSHDSNTDVQLEEAELAEPIVASLPQQDNKMILLSWSSSYLLEKDIKDKLTEKLELSSLMSLESQAVSGSVDAGTGDEKVELTLRFDYINKDRQRRFYLLDVADSKAIISHIQPFLDARIADAKAKLSAVMQCLKCNRTFLKSEVLKKEKELPLSGNLQDLKALQELMDKTTFMCPKCSSSMVIDYTPSVSSVTATSTSSQPDKSTSSTPVGSYNSNEGWMDRVKQKPPAILTRMKSADRFELPGGRLSQLVRQKSSQSMDTSISRKSSIRSTGSVSRDSRADSTGSTRERSNAFLSNKMSRSVAVTEGQKSVPAQGQLIPIEDYFDDEAVKPDVSSRQLAAMTTSLRGDSSTTGSNAAPVRKPPLKQTKSDGFARPGDSTSRFSGDLTDSGFMSGVNSQSLDGISPASQGFAGSWSKNGVSISKMADARGDFQSGSLSESEKDVEQLKRKFSTGSQHTHLSAMQELVNSIVNEGHSLGEQDSTSQQGSFGAKSMSVAAFRDLVSSSPSNNRPRSSPMDTLASGTNFHRSDSASSIAVLSRGNSVGDDTCSGIISFAADAGSNAAKAGSEGRASRTGEGEGETVSRVVSPLSSDICSSMVSSVYESSVRAVAEDSVNGLNQDTSSQRSAEDAPTLTPLGIDNDSNSSSSEDMTSIYDLPSKPKKSQSKKSSKARKWQEILDSKDVAGDDSESKSGADGESSFPQAASEDIVDVNTLEERNGVNDASDTLPPDEASSEQVVAHSDNAGGENGEGFDDSDVETLSELDMTPQYAFHHLNHRLTLYLMMTLFEPHEEFVCKIQGEFSQYIIDESYEGIFVMSSARFYILKIKSEDHTQDPEHWLSCIEIQPIPELRYIDLGLGGQSLRLEFVTDCSSYTIITRNRDRTAQFIDVLHTNLAKYAVSHGIASHVVVNEDVDQMTLDNLDKDVLSKVVPDQKLLLYCMGYIQRGFTDKFPVSFVISTNDVCLVRTCHQWPQPRLQAPVTVETVGRQFVVLERQLVNNVASVNVDEVSMRKISLELFNEQEGVSTHWNITMATRQSTVDFVHALSIPWEREFGVEMDVGYSELDF